jgi:hypothetical protein
LKCGPGHSTRQVVRVTQPMRSTSCLFRHRSSAAEPRSVKSGDHHNLKGNFDEQR